MSERLRAQENRREVLIATLFSTPLGTMISGESGQHGDHSYRSHRSWYFRRGSEQDDRFFFNSVRLNYALCVIFIMVIG